jgi:predicted DNA binding CopG/RHH family protein
MKKKIVYTDELINARIIENFLPSPDKLIFKEKKTRVTLALSDRSLDFFKDAAKKHGASYQAMIRRLVDYYVANQKSA